MSDLAQLLAQFEREEYAASVDAHLPETRRHAVRGTVVRARRVRAAATIAVATIAAVACGAGAWALTQPDRDDPAVPDPSPTVTTPSPSASPTPSASVTPEPVLTMPDFKGDVTVNPQLPTAEAITPEAWNAAGPGWVLATYQANVSTTDAATGTVAQTEGPAVMYLVSPDATRYQLSGIGNTSTVLPISWQPQAPEALVVVIQHRPPYKVSWAAIDLADGRIRPILMEDTAAYPSWIEAAYTTVRERPGLFGVSPWDTVAVQSLFPREIEGGQNLGPRVVVDSTWAVDFLAASTTASALVPTGETCNAITRTATMVVVQCGPTLPPGADPSEPQYHPKHLVFVADRGQGDGTVISTSSPEADGAWNLAVPTRNSHTVGDAVVANVGLRGPSGGSADGVCVASPAGITPLPGQASVWNFPFGHTADVIGTTSSTVYSVVGSDGGDESFTRPLVADDTSNGNYTVLIPNLAVAQNAGERWSGGVTGAYVVP